MVVSLKVGCLHPIVKQASIPMIDWGRKWDDKNNDDDNNIQCNPKINIRMKKQIYNTNDEDYI